MKAVLWLVGGIFKGIVNFGSFSYSVFEAIVHSLTRFTDDRFHEFVMREVNLNTKKFL